MTDSKRAIVTTLYFPIFPLKSNLFDHDFFVLFYFFIEKELTRDTLALVSHWAFAPCRIVLLHRVHLTLALRFIGNDPFA